METKVIDSLEKKECVDEKIDIDVTYFKFSKTLHVIH